MLIWTCAHGGAASDSHTFALSEGKAHIEVGVDRSHEKGALIILKDTRVNQCLQKETNNTPCFIPPDTNAMR